MKPLRVLLVTRECLRTDSNEGNVLLNLFAGQPVALANLYCKPGLPDTDACEAYFQLTDRMALDNLLRRTPMGRRVSPQTEEIPATPGQSAAPIPDKRAAEAENKAFYDFFRVHNGTLFHMAREWLWALADFRSPALRAFVLDFAPDVIFAPLCYSRFVLAVQRYVIGLAGVPAVTYLYDDLYSLRQYSLSPLFWLHRFAQRRAIRKTLPYYRYAYTMTPQQADEYARMLPLPMRLLRKGVASTPADEPTPHEGVRLIYAGGIYFGRDRTLGAVADAVRALRREGIAVQLDLYSSSPLSKAARRALTNGDGCTVHPAVSLTELARRYRQSDVALHAESFRRKDALVTRLSFSTKIVDCLGSGCAVLAICPAINAGWQYLKEEDAAVCVANADGIPAAVRALACDPALRKAYARKALSCLARNHDGEAIRRGLLADLQQLAAGREA